MSGADIRAVLFDMDGTLVDTAPDIAVSLNVALEAEGLHALDARMISDMVGKGARVLVERALVYAGESADPQRVERILDRYLHEFSQRRGNDGGVFPGAVDCLEQLRNRDLKLGVVSNALQRSAEATLEHYGLIDYLDIVLGGDQTAKPKPHPEPLWTVCRKLGVPVERTLMVGDSANDVTAARAAGCWIVCVPHGYNEGRPIEELGCPILPHLRDLPTWLDCIPAQAGSSSAA